MNRTPVTSSNIQSVGYDPVSRVMEVEFGQFDIDYPTNRVYVYRDVPPEVHQALMEHPSHGHYLNMEIAFKYPYELVGTIAEIEASDD